MYLSSFHITEHNNLCQERVLAQSFQFQLIATDLKLILQYAEIIKRSTFNCTVSQDGHHGINLSEMKHLSNAFALTPLESLNYQ